MGALKAQAALTNLAQGNSIGCTTCKMTVDFLEKFVQNPDVQQQVQGDINKLCDMISNSILRDSCVTLATDYPGLLQLLLDQVAPEKVCTLITLCKSSTQKAASIAATSNFCRDCRIELTLLKPFLSGDQKPLDGLADKICGDLPADFKTSCTGIVNAALNNVLSALEDPAGFCNMMSHLSGEGGCPTLTEDAALGATIYGRNAVVEAADPTMHCKSCRGLVQFVANKLQSPSSAKALLGAAKMACQSLPDNYRSKCDLVIEKYGDAIFDRIKNSLTPDNVCGSLLGICPSGFKRF